MAGNSTTPVVVLSDEENTDEKVSEATEPESEDKEEDDTPYLTGKPRFDVVLSKSNVGYRPQLGIPRKISKMLPRARIPVVIRYQNKKFYTSYHGDVVRARLSGADWGFFVKDNGLRVGDACVFELMEYSKKMIEFRLLILRGDIPHQLVAYLNNEGCEENPIEVE